ncbi:hypothetical protein CFC21_112194 [Triticum aestivum]|uniref:Uncharacterized protein n=2 Tax=Triticum aestivum TaxID=4565 RepID=A0A9R0GKN6_WHEAT|nr:hypothetical protein [Triticum aestivum]
MSLRIGKNPIFPLRLFDLQRSCSVCGGDYQYGATELLLPVACTGLLLLVVRHMMCTLGRPVRRTANETTPNVMSVLTFCNQATALLRSPPARVQRRSSNNNTGTGEAGDRGESRETAELHQQELEEKQQWELGKKQQPELKEKQ